MPQEDANCEHPATWCSPTTRSAARPIEQDHTSTHPRWRSAVHREDLLDLQLLRNFPGRGSMNILHDSPKIMTSFVFRKPMGKMDSCRPIRFWSAQFRLLGTDRPSAFIRVSWPTEQLLHMWSPVRAVTTLCDHSFIQVALSLSLRMSISNLT